MDRGGGFARFPADGLAPSVYIAGQVLKKLLRTYPDKVDGQEALSEKKAQLIYSALEAHPDVYKIIPDKSVRSNMNICFRVTKASLPPSSSFGLPPCTPYS